MTEPSSLPTPTRRPEARRALAHYVVAAFSLLAASQEAGDEVPFAVDHVSRGRGPVLYEYRRLYGSYIEAHHEQIVDLADHRLALDVLGRDAAVLAWATEGAGRQHSATTAIESTILLPVLVGVAERAGGFEPDDIAIDAVISELEQSVAARHTTYTAFVPLVGLRIEAKEPIDLGAGVSVRTATIAELAVRWPESQGLLPEGFGERADRCAILDLLATVPRTGESIGPDAARACIRAVRALRLACGGGVGSGPVLLERVDFGPRAARALPVAASPIMAEPAVLDSPRAGVARSLVIALAEAEVAGSKLVSSILPRYDDATSALAEDERTALLLSVLDALLAPSGEGRFAAIMRAAALVGSTAAERERISRQLRSVDSSDTRLSIAGPGVELARLADDVLRAAIASGLEQALEPEALAATLDGVLLGARPRPSAMSTLSRTA